MHQISPCRDSDILSMISPIWLCHHTYFAMYTTNKAPTINCDWLYEHHQARKSISEELTCQDIKQPMCTVCSPYMQFNTLDKNE